MLELGAEEGEERRESLSFSPAGRRGKPRLRGGGRLLTRNPGPRSDTIEPARGPGKGRAVAPSPPPAPTPPSPAPGRRGALGASPRAPNSRGSRLGPAPLRLLGSRVAAAPGREGAKEEGRGGEESPAGERTEAAGRRLGAAGSPRGGGRRGGGAQLRRPPAGGAGGRAAAVPHHVGVLQASPLLLRLRSEWTAAAAAAPLTGLPGSRSCAVRDGPGAARGGSPGLRGGGGTGAGARHPARGFPGARGPPGRGARAGQGGDARPPRADILPPRLAVSGGVGGRRTPTSASYALLPRSDGAGTPTRGEDERCSVT